MIDNTKYVDLEYHFRKPQKADGAEVWELIKNTKILDLNSSYSYLIWCDIFSDTSIVVVRKNRIVGFVSAFIHPNAMHTLFVWQVAVNESERGKGLATKMLLQLLGRDPCKDVRYVEATISPSNKPSQHLFRGLANKLGADCHVTEYMAASDFPQEGHEDEHLFSIGPFKS